MQVLCIESYRERRHVAQAGGFAQPVMTIDRQFPIYLHARDQPFPRCLLEVRGVPEQYYRDWLNVAAEEAYHFSLLSDHLKTLGYAYGDFPAHHGLWDMVSKTKGDVLARMALVPRTLEARGLDASRPMSAKSAQAGDQAAAEIVDIIFAR